jgi:hypothetical protein
MIFILIKHNFFTTKDAFDFVFKKIMSNLGNETFSGTLDTIVLIPKALKVFLQVFCENFNHQISSPCSLGKIPGKLIIKSKSNQRIMYEQDPFTVSQCVPEKILFLAKIRKAIL